MSISILSSSLRLSPAIPNGGFCWRWFRQRPYQPSLRNQKDSQRPKPLIELNSILIPSPVPSSSGPCTPAFGGPQRYAGDRSTVAEERRRSRRPRHGRLDPAAPRLLQWQLYGGARVAAGGSQLADPGGWRRMTAGFTAMVLDPICSIIVHETYTIL